MTGIESPRSMTPTTAPKRAGAFVVYAATIRSAASAVSANG